MARRGLPVRRPDRTTATPDYYVPTGGGGLADITDEKRAMVLSLSANVQGSGPGRGGRAGEAAMRRVLADGLRTADIHQNGTRLVGTAAMADAVAAALH